jgi:hypothetical protein
MLKLWALSLRVIWRYPEVLFYHLVLTWTGIVAFLAGLVVFLAFLRSGLSPWVFLPLWFVFMAGVLAVATGLSTLNILITGLVIRSVRDGHRLTPDRAIEFVRQHRATVLAIARSAYLSIRIPVRVRADLLTCALVISGSSDLGALGKMVEHEFSKAEWLVTSRRGRAGMIVSLLWLPVFLTAILVLPRLALDPEWRRALFLAAGLSLIPITWLFRMFHGLSIPSEVFEK